MIRTFQRPVLWPEARFCCTLARLVYYHPSTDQMINYRIHTTPEGVVTKIEIEKKIKGKKEWIELKQLPCE